MSDTDLISIGAFATRAGMTASALRFYDDAGLLHPVQVDPLTGYRFYSESQFALASQLRRLRLIGMPLPTIRRFFDSTTAEAIRLIDEQAARVAAEAAVAQQVAATLKASLSKDPALTLCVLPGPVFAAAVDQVMAACDPETPALAGVRLEADPDAVSLTATDGYRLAARTLVPRQYSAATWAGTLAGDDLRAIVPQLRRSPAVTVEAGERTVALHTTNGAVAHCRLLAEDFPDCELLLASLPEVTHRLTVESHLVLTALEQAPPTIGLRIADGLPSLVLPDADISLTGTVAGPDLLVWFELTTVYPALIHALGNDIMLDLRGADGPTTVRSADNGDLTSLVMPCPARPSQRMVSRPR